MKDQRTGEDILLPERARGLIIGRKEREGVVVLMNGLRAYVFVHRIEGSRVALRLVAEDNIEFHRIVGRVPVPEFTRKFPEPDAPLTEERDEPEELDARRTGGQ